MQADRLILAFDTSAAHCAAALLQGNTVLAARHEPMTRGQAERLMPLIEELLSEAQRGFADLDALAVGTGPGNFTGIRIAVSAARGLALARAIPAVGVSNFEAVAWGAPPTPMLISVAGSRGQAYLQLFDQGAPRAKPVNFDPAAPETALAVTGAQSVTGQMADAVALPLGLPAVPRDVAPERLAETIARIANARLDAGEEVTRPAPMYVRAADAAPPSDPPPVILED